MKCLMNWMMNMETKKKQKALPGCLVHKQKGWLETGTVSFVGPAGPLPVENVWQFQIRPQPEVGDVARVVALEELIEAFGENAGANPNQILRNQPEVDRRP